MKDALVQKFSLNGSVTARISTTDPSDLLVAFVGGCGPSDAPQTAQVSGGGLTWTLVGRTNTEDGTSEIWTARASGVMSGLRVKATLSYRGFPIYLTVVAFANATGTGVSTSASGSTGVPHGTLTTTASPSWVWGVGDDRWRPPSARSRRTRRCSPRGSLRRRTPTGFNRSMTKPHRSARRSPSMTRRRRAIPGI